MLSNNVSTQKVHVFQLAWVYVLAWAGWTSCRALTYHPERWQDGLREALAINIIVGVPVTVYYSYATPAEYLLVSAPNGKRPYGTDHGAPSASPPEISNLQT